MAARRKQHSRVKGRGKLPTGVRRFREGFRPWANVRGKRVDGPVCETVAEAEAIAIKMRELQVVRGPVVGEAGLGDGVELLRRHTRSDETWRYYAVHIKPSLQRWGEGFRLRAITRRDVEDARDQWEAEVGPATVANRMKTLARIYKLAKREGWVEYNPADAAAVDRPRQRVPEMHWFTTEELASVLRRVAEWEVEVPTARRFGLWCRVLVATGLRRSEFLHTADADWNLRRCSVFVRHGKTNTREVPFPASLVPALHALYDIQGQFAPPSRGAFDKAWPAWQRRLGEPRLHAHALRHTYGTTMAAHGVDVVRIGRLMGHSRLEITMRYLHATGDQTRAAVDVLEQALPLGGESPTGPRRPSGPTCTQTPAQHRGDRAGSRSRPSGA